MLTLEMLEKMLLAAAVELEEKSKMLCELDSVAGDGDHGVVEGRADMDLALLDVLLFTTAANNLLTGLSVSHILSSLLTSSCSQWSSWGPCGYERWSCCADRARAGRGDDGCRDSSRSRSDA